MYILRKIHQFYDCWFFTKATTTIIYFISVCIFKSTFNGILIICVFGDQEETLKIQKHFEILI